MRTQPAGAPALPAATTMHQRLRYLSTHVETDVAYAQLDCAIHM